MANTISTIAMNPLKNIVSKRRKRYQKDGFNLDLTYIQPNLIAMGFPAEKLERVYRNDIDEVKKFLEIKHRNNYKVYNLCSERTYDKAWFEHFSYYPFDDHNPPNIQLIKDFCDDVLEWLSVNDDHVAAVHCKAGKGRTGTMICCYLLHVGIFSTAQDALNCYGQERTHDKKGVTIPSQRRYVNYYAYLLESGKQYSPVSLQICEIKLSPPPLINNNQGTIVFSISDTTPNKILDCEPVPDFKKTDDFVLIKMNQCIPLAGDIKVEFSRGKGKSKELFHFWFNTFFVDEMVEVRDGLLVSTLTKCEIDDAHKDKSCKIFPVEFKVEIVMQKIVSGPFANPYKHLPDQINQLNTNNGHQKNYSNHNLSTNNGKHIMNNSKLAPTKCGSGIENNFLVGPGSGSYGIDVVDHHQNHHHHHHHSSHTNDHDDDDAGTATVVGGAQDVLQTPSESNSETLSSSEPSSSGEEWESEPEIGNLIASQHADSTNTSGTTTTNGQNLVQA